MSKKVIFLTFFPIAFLSNPFSGYFEFPSVGRPVSYIHIEFGRNRPINKNFRAPEVSKNQKVPFMARSDRNFSTSHRRHLRRAAENVSTKLVKIGW